MKVGYVRVSTWEQTLDLQIDALKKAGCEKIFEDHETGWKAQRPGFLQALEFLRPGDTLVVWKTDRLGRSTIHLVKLLNELQERGVNYISLTEQMDTTTPHGKFLFTLSAAFAELERSLIIERTRAGLQAARARGRVGGRKQKITPEKGETALALYEANRMSISQICKTVGVCRATLYKFLRKHGHPHKNKKTKEA